MMPWRISEERVMVIGLCFFCALVARSTVLDPQTTWPVIEPELFRIGAKWVGRFQPVVVETG